MVKAEFSERLLGESPKVECTPDAPAEFNFSTSLNCSFEDPSVLDEIAHKPVVCELTLHCVELVMPNFLVMFSC